MAKTKHAPDSVDAFTRIETLARDAKAMPGLRNDALLQIVNVGLAELQNRRLLQGPRKLGAPPAGLLQADSRPTK